MFRLSPCRKQRTVLMIAFLAAMPLLLGPVRALAGHEHGYRHGGRSHYHHSGHARGFAHGHDAFRYGHGRRYYYSHRRHFYSRAPRGFFSVTVPFGAIVATLPVGYFSLHIGGIRYFEANNIYYRPVPAGYEVVQAPVRVSPPSPPQQASTVQEQRLVVQALALNVRSGPGPNFSVIGVLHEGDKLAVQGDSPGWDYVQLPDGQNGWVMEKFTASVEPVPQG